MPRRNATLLGFGALGLFWGASVGALPAMLLAAGPAIDRYGPRAVAVACAVFGVAATLPGLATSLPALVLALLATGAASGALDVGINANAAQIEAESGKRLMPLAHALYSVGLLVGAVAAGLARGAGVGREPILLGVALMVFATAALLGTDPASATLAQAEPRTIRIERALLLIGLVGAAAFVVEGGIESWSALFLERQLDAQPAVSGLGPGVFGASMALGRFYGQATRFGDRALLTGGSGVAVLGCLLAAAAPNAPLALLGFALGGAGISLNAPVVFGAAGRVSASAVASVTTLGYVGLLIGPPLVGGAAQAISLRGSFVVLAAVAAAVAAAATRLRIER